MASCGVAISTVGCQLFIDDATPGTADVEVKGHTSISFSGDSSDEIETTSMCDTEKQFLDGLVDLGTCSISHNPDFTDAGQVEMRTEKGSNVEKTFKLTLANGDDIDWTATVAGGSTDLGVNSKVEGSWELRIKTKPQVTPSGGSAGNL